MGAGPGNQAHGWAGKLAGLHFSFLEGNRGSLSSAACLGLSSGSEAVALKVHELEIAGCAVLLNLPFLLIVMPGR